jgi:hypothetical protein
MFRVDRLVAGLQMPERPIVGSVNPLKASRGVTGGKNNRAALMRMRISKA